MQAGLGIDRHSAPERFACGDHSAAGIAALRDDEWIVCQAVLGKDVHEVYANTRVSVAVERQSAEYMLSQVYAVPEVGVQLTGVIGA